MTGEGKSQYGDSGFARMTSKDNGDGKGNSKDNGNGKDNGNSKDNGKSKDNGNDNDRSRFPSGMTKKLQALRMTNGVR